MKGDHIFLVLMKYKRQTLRSVSSVSLVVLALLPWTCQKRLPSTPAPPPPNYFEMAEEHFETGDYASAVDAYNAYLRDNPSADNRDRVLFRLAMSHALPGSPVRDLPRAMELFGQLASAFPQSPFTTQTEFLLRLQAEVDQLRSDLTTRDERIRALTQELERLKQIDMRRLPARSPD